MPANEIVKYTIEGHTAIITLNRPEKRNAISSEMLDILMSYLEDVASENDVRALVVRGEGPTFCAGADLKERLSMSEKQVHAYLDRIGSFFSELENLPFPSIAALDGDAFGGGLELALCCTFIVMHKGIRVGLPETSLGIIPGAGGTKRLARRIGVTKAMEMILLARTIDPDTALNYGLANYVQHDSATVAALKLSKEISEKAPLAVRLAKAAILEGADKDIASALKVERKMYNQTLKTEDRKEALIAFQEKRKPVFKGR
ncbi:enoyl-CoA hydratase [Leptospira perolatii]|uniref:Enoyl-CoA hydratase n=1 Tax=Leptospira perolatii TaxID=2023191 RepID=A0A2M9ZRJ5_9LEPT|nr:enoyl-CoA hydratase-related protein [Leptospira perolatii]PJZ71021.1 enoyl-CoA hydratase [Leptospira perolatii]PJZ74553.1 enoyl-CoA hydratase [Leptospira perolatii]